MVGSEIMGKPWYLFCERVVSRARRVRPIEGREVTSLVMTWDTGTPKVCSSLLSRKGKPLNQIIRSAMPPFPKRSLTALVTPTTILQAFVSYLSKYESNIETHHRR